MEQKNVVNSGDQLEVTKPLQPENAEISRKTPVLNSDSDSNHQTFRPINYGENEPI